MANIGGDIHRLRPALSSVRRGECSHVSIESENRHNYFPPRLHHWHAADSIVRPSSAQRRSPGLPAIGGGAHPDQVALRRVVPLRIAVAVKRAGGLVVADNPVLVGGTRPSDRDWVAPSDPVGRPADRYRSVIPDRQRRDQPNVMQSVIRHRRIAGRRVRSALVNRNSRQIAIGPAHAAIGRSREPNVGAASTENPSHLKGAHHR